MDKPTKGLRFAPIIRVSTPGKQEKTSPAVQKEQIELFVKFLEGSIATWEYCGQEHATPDHERELLDALLRDCAKDKFDAVIVHDATRWSRDILKHEQSIRTFREHKIHFFTGVIEIDLFDVNFEVALSIQVLLAQYLAKLQKQRSLMSKIKLAKKGGASCGKLPYGRTFNKKTGEWGRDEEKAEKIILAAGRYLDRVPNRENAAMAGLNWPFLWKTMCYRSGDTWEQRFGAKDLNIDITIHKAYPIV